MRTDPSNWLAGDMKGWHLRSIAVTIVALVVCGAVAGCSLRASSFVLSPRHVRNATVHPFRVGVVIDKEFTPYHATVRWWSSPPFVWSLGGLPDAFVETLRPHFLCVELIQQSPCGSNGAYDLIAKMSIDRLQFDGANTTGMMDRVDLTMTFSIQRPDTTDVVRTTLSSSSTIRYNQPCMFCRPDPRNAFYEAFNAVFMQLSETLGSMDIQGGPLASD